MSIRRVALIYDDKVRPDTTGTHCRSALEELADVEHFHPSELDDMPCKGFDLYLNIDDGLRYCLPDHLHPKAWWAIDTHMDFQWYNRRSPSYDFVFTAQLDGARRLTENGITNVHWLPLACNPAIHYEYEIAKEHNICFVGHVAPGPRQQLLLLLKKHFSNVLIGQRYLDEMARAYSASRIIFNRSVKDDLNMRVFEAMACGSLLLTNALPHSGQDELFTEGVHLVTYADPGEMLEKAEYYLKHKDQRERIAEAGREEVLRSHTYRHRMEKILRTIEKHSISSCVFKGRKATNGSLVPRPKMIGSPSISCDGTNSLKKCAAEKDRHSRGNKCVTRNNKHMAYYEFSRPELLSLVPTTAKHILDIGCGSGRLGETIKARQEATVVGIEIHEQAAESARTRLDEVIVGDAETLDKQLTEAPFDCIICADVLEHMRDPKKLLQKSRTWLCPDGCLIASIPNVRHHSVVRSLLAGNWTYESAGILDDTHLRFFTRRNIEEMLCEAGYKIVRCQTISGPGEENWHNQNYGELTQLRKLGGQKLSITEAGEYFTQQYLIVAEPSTVAAQERMPAVDARVASKQNFSRKLKILYFDRCYDSPNTSKIAKTIREFGHYVEELDERSVKSPEALIKLINNGDYDCLLFFKGRINPKTQTEMHSPSGDGIAHVLREIKIPGYTWYFDKVLDFDYNRSREAWMQKVAPLCRVAFVTDGALAKCKEWGRWHVLHQGVHREDVQLIDVPEDERSDIAFVGNIYGDRDKELAPLSANYKLDVVCNAHGPKLSRILRSYKIIIGPRYPSVPDYWSARLYIMLGHGAFFLAPEIAGMREEGFISGVHYASLSDDPVADVRYWLARPAERERIAKAGQEYVLNNFTYHHRVKELLRVIGGTLNNKAR